MYPRKFIWNLSLTIIPLAALAQEARVEQARQFQPASSNSVREQHSTATGAMDLTPAGAEDDSFGVQALLKNQERERAFRGFAEITGFVTNNVALTHKAETSDTFLIATFGMEYRKKLTAELELDASFRGGLFRYNKVSALNFISIDTGAALTWHAQALWNLDFTAGYNFTDLINDRQGDSFFQNHAITLAVQKTIPLSRAHYFYAGASALFGFADPVVEQRDEYALFAGYHLQATRHLDADLLYRYARYVYSKNGRDDDNQAITLSARYAVRDWVSVFASTFAGFNRSNYTVFDYNVVNAGVGLGVSVKF